MRIVIATLLACLTADASDSDRSDALRRLESMRLSVDFRELPLAEAVDYVREATDLNIVIHGVERPGTVDLKVRDVSARSVLRLMLRPLGLSLVYREGAFLIVPPGRLPGRARLEVYDVRALNLGLWDFPGVDITLHREMMGISLGIEMQEPAPPIGENLEDLIVTSTGGDSWNGDPEVSIQLSNGLLFVRQTPEVHAQIRRLITMLGRAR